MHDGLGHLLHLGQLILHRHHLGAGLPGLLLQDDLLLHQLQVAVEQALITGNILDEAAEIEPQVVLQAGHLHLQIGDGLLVIGQPLAVTFQGRLNGGGIVV